MLISAHTGGENFPQGTTKFHLFFVPTRDRMGREAHIGQMAKGLNPDVPVTAQATQFFSAMVGAPQSLGFWNRANYEVPEGVVLKVFGFKRGTIQNQQLPSTQAAMYIQLRSSANLERISFNTLQAPRSQFSAVHIEGRFDVLTMADMGQLGISITPQMISQIDQRAVSRLFTVTTLDRQTAPRTQLQTKLVKNSEGQSVKVTKTNTPRAVRL